MIYSLTSRSKYNPDNYELRGTMVFLWLLLLIAVNCGVPIHVRTHNRVARDFYYQFIH